MTNIHHPDTTARDTAEQIARTALGNPAITDVITHLLMSTSQHAPADATGHTSATKDADEIHDWLADATIMLTFPPICAAQVRYMRNRDDFGPDGWTWCEVVDGEVDDFTLPRCTDQDDAVAQATAWLAKQKRVDPAFPQPVVEERAEESE